MYHHEVHVGKNSVILVRIDSNVIWGSARASMKGCAGISCFEQNFSSQGEESPAWSAFLKNV